MPIEINPGRGIKKKSLASLMDMDYRNLLRNLLYFSGQTMWHTEWHTEKKREKRKEGKKEEKRESERGEKTFKCSVSPPFFFFFVYAPIVAQLTFLRQARVAWLSSGSQLSFVQIKAL